jgi:LDH2 family malate/lactate/ureidoglycolate dehydrogenase
VTSDPVYTAAELRRFTADALRMLGTPADIADQVATSLVLSNLVGHDSHGVIRIVQYAHWLHDSQIRAAARPVVRRRRGVAAVVDGGWGFGQPAARLATDLAAAAAHEHGMAAVAIAACNHVGRLGDYVGALAEAGLVGLAWCNSGPAVAPYGGTRRALGTNPFAWAAPGGPAGPLVLDFSTAGVAEGKLRIAFAAGAMVAPGLIIDAGGNPTTDPADFFAGGALLPFGGHKGSGMSILIELLGGLLTGMGVSSSPDYAGGNGTVVLALDVATFVDPDDFGAYAADFRASVVAAGGAGAGPGGVLMPGDVEAQTRRRRERDGIPVGAGVLRQIHEITDPAGVPRAVPMASRAQA